MITRRRCSRFASAKVRLFRKPAKDCKRFFKKNAKKRGRKGVNDGRRESIPYYIIYREGKRKTENGTDAGSESRKREQKQNLF